MRFIILLCLLLNVASAIAQDKCDYVVEGTVYDLSSREPLPFANVHIDGTNKGASTNEKGYFRIENICKTEFDLIFTYVGYKQVIHHHDVHHELPEIFLAPDAYTLQSVVVEADKLEEYVQSISSQSIDGRDYEELNTGNLADLTANISGVSSISTGQNISKPMIHGLHSNRVVIINNGVRHEFQNWGQEHAPEIDPELATSVSVVKGAGTVRYGPEALGGVILLNGPTMELHEKLKGKIGMQYQSNGRGVEANGEIRQGGERISWMAQGGYTLQGDRRAPDYMLTNTGKREWTAAGGIRYHRPNFDLRLLYSHFSQELGVLRSSVTGSLEDLNNAIESDVPLIVDPFSYEINNPRQRVDHDMVKLNGQIHGKDQLLEITYAFQRNLRQEYDVRRGVLNERPSIDLELFSNSLDIDWLHPSVGAFEGRMGMQWTYQDNNNIPGTNTVNFIPNYNLNRFGIYLIESLSKGQNEFDFGIRYDYQYVSVRGREQDNSVYASTLSFQNFSATAGWYRKLSSNWNFRSNIGTAWRPPNVFELYVFGKHQASIEYGLFRYERQEDGTIDTDVILDENEKDIFSEIGYKWVNTFTRSKGSTEMEITGYVNYIRNFIYATPAGITLTVRGAFPFFVYEQTDAMLAGIDFTTRFTHSSEWMSEAKGSFLYARDVSKQDYFVEMPPVRIDYNLVYSPSFGSEHDLKFKAGFTYLFRQFMAPDVIPVSDFLEGNPPEVSEGNFDFTETPDGVMLVSAGIFGKWNRFDYSLQVQNLLNQSYRLNTDSFRYFADQAGINLHIKLTYNF
ncbi:TonB-dependent receptor [Fulvivirga sedimenti]|uniref:Carboxypeptidase-like regulatory domain-containing protein n=1 Tax=Fulvivirga sedimenti TaxID=2879465 RepID=A0A9X1L188_9BACT|nr:TonB-dependent receptor [Fulvivirga sedimenti]MCA6075504.1 carboxypeptidase-like regulatory domain-containing protein [Fulvivirga sedimenti]MCA6076681.1 carboxypeptidase-like regulatory domain-containing protein [Fulvivirga sedimenti]MCA6077809.1 carboxypeptidase-like regulatory domain-containing protein [Fulvivirga sedimenti]